MSLSEFEKRAITNIHKTDKLKEGIPWKAAQLYSAFLRASFHFYFVPFPIERVRRAHVNLRRGSIFVSVGKPFPRETREKFSQATHAREYDDRS